MKKKRFSVGQITAVLQQVEGGAAVGDVCRQVGISEQTYYRWKKVYGGMPLSEARELAPAAPDQSDATARAVPPIVAAGVWVTLAVCAFLAVDPALDDAYIVYRYVVRFLAGEGLTFNNGEYVEGYTSVAWTLLLAAATYLTGFKPHVASVVLNYAAILGTAVALHQILAIRAVQERSRYAALALLAASFQYFNVCFLGLEFGLFSLVLMLFYGALFTAIRSPSPARRLPWVAAGILGAALFPTRPESVAVVPLVVAALWAFGRDRNTGVSLLHLVGPWCLGIVAVLAWRLAYYGEWLPNSVIAKSVSRSSLGSLSHVWRDVLHGLAYLRAAYTANPGLAVIAALFIGRAGLHPRRHLDAVLLSAPILVGHAAVVQNGGDWMPSFRFVNVFTPLYLAILFVLAKDWVGERASRGAAGLLVFAVLYVGTNVPHADPKLVHHVGRFPGWMDLYRQAGEALNPVWVDGDVLVAESIGMVGYAAPDVFIHDPLGLTDRALAHDETAARTVYGRKNWKYSLSLDPAAILLHYWPHQAHWKTFTRGYPEDYAFYYLPWTANTPRGCVYAILRNDREAVYGKALQPLGAVKVEYGAIEFPCRSPGVSPAP